MHKKNKRTIIPKKRNRETNELVKMLNNRRHEGKSATIFKMTMNRKG